MIRIPESKFMESFLNQQKESMYKIQKYMEEYKVSFCFIGGGILPFYGYIRMTEDIDILVDSKDKKKLKFIPPAFMKDISYNSNEIRRMKLHDPQTLIEIVYSGEDLNQSGFSFPDPKKVSIKEEGFPILSLRNLILFKLQSGIFGKNRFNDFGDIKTLIYKNNLSYDFVQTDDEIINKKYLELWREVEK